ncbi:MAG: HD domain-containing protein [Desulfobacterium sp.]|nr:HD domain-containing protein [Desulfobacterium sp.]
MKCPGQDTQYWNQEAIFETPCPKCKTIVEFFKDDTSRVCRGCGERMVNPNIDFGCASYCQYAEQCLGTLPEEFLQNRDDLLKDRVAVEMKRYFHTDFKRIGHALRVARHAEAIGKAELGNMAVILCAAYLHDIGIKKAEENHNSTAPEFQELEGPPIARQILERLDAKSDLVDEVCDIIGHHHHPGENESLNFKVVYDADLLTNLEETQKKTPRKRDELETIIEKSFLTQSGREKAAAILLNQDA